MSFRKYSCAICDHVYDEEKGDPDCECGATKADFTLMACALS